MAGIADPEEFELNARPLGLDKPGNVEDKNALDETLALSFNKELFSLLSDLKLRFTFFRRALGLA